MFKKLLLFSFFALSFLRSEAAYIPVPLTGYNADVVANGIGAPATSTSGIATGFDSQGYWLVDSTFRTTSTSPLTTAPAMPTNLIVTSSQDPNVVWNLMPYTGNNALRINTIGTDSLLLQTPTAGAEVYILYTNVVTGSNGTQTITINFTDGTTQVVSNSPMVNWFGGSANLVRIIGGRLSPSGAFENNNSATGGPLLYQFKISLLAANYTKTIRSIKFDNNNAGNLFNVFAVTLNTACNGPVTAGATASSAGASACSGVNFTLSLPSATAGVGITYQWQSSTTGGAPWTNIASATNSTYVANQTVPTSYRAYITCSGTTADTSTPITVTIKPANQCYCVPVATSTTLYIPSFSTTGGTTNISTTSGTSVTSPGYSDYSGTQNVTAMQTTTVNFNVGLSTTGGFGIAIFVDWNQNGTFEASEKVYNTTAYSFVTSNPGSFVVPVTALPGVTRMRVMADFNSNSVANGPCTITSGTSGEAEDYSFTVVPLPPCTTPNAPTALSLMSSFSTVSGSFTAPAPAADRYIVIRTLGGPLVGAPVSGTTYTVGAALGNGTVISISNTTSFANSGLTASTSYTYTVFALNDLCSGGPLYSTTPASGTVTTTGTPTTYSWNGAVSNDWTTPANWTPTRNAPDPTDILQFNNGLVDTANNIPTQTIRKLLVTNNTSAYLQAATAGARTLTIADTVAATIDLDITNGSFLYSNGNATALTINFSGANNKTNIAGRMESVSNAVNNVFDFANTVATVTSTGVLSTGGSNANQAIANATVTNLQINGLYDYKYTVNTVGLPTASWNTGSTCLISGYTTVTGGPNGGQNQTFYNFTYNCPNQTSAANWSGTGATTVTNNFTVTSTGTGSWIYASTQAFNAQIKNYIQTGGTFNLASASASSVQVFNVSGSFTKSGGILTAGGTTAASQPTINFNGTTAQTASFDVSPTGQFVYRFSNPAGVNLLGTSGLTTFNVNNNGGIRITTTAAAPITTALTIAYGTTNTTLYYDTAGSYTMTANVYPTTAGPQNLNINLGNNSNVITMPFSRTVPGTLTMAAGDLNISTNTLTLGTTAAAPGTLTYTAGNNIRVTTGSFVRWYGTTGLPLTGGTGIGFYPVSFGPIPRHVAFSFNTATSLSTGGTIGVGHTNATGLATVSVADGAYTIERRTNAFWTVNAAGLVLSGTNKIRMQLNGTALFTTPTPANLRVMQPAAVAGIHAAGAGVTALRTDLVVADLTNMNYHIGAALVDIGGVYTAINTGNWSTGSTWDVGVAPGVTNDAFINPGVTVTVDAATNTAKSLTNNGGTLIASSAANILTIDSAFTNNGAITLNGGSIIINGGVGNNGFTNNAGSIFNHTSGTMRVGPVGGGNKRFTHAGGTMNISGGNLNLNGNLNISGGSFNQTNGTITIDGNSGTAATSVPSGTHLCAITPGSPSNFSGGTLLFVDPPHSSYASASTRTLSISSNITNTIFGGTHLIQIGDGVSTEPGNANGFTLETFASSRTPVNNVTVNSGNVTGRWMTGSYNNSTVFGFHMKGNLTINAGSEVRTGLLAGSGNEFHVGGNIVNNGTLTAWNTRIMLGAITAISMPAVAQQTVGGTGVFQNNTTAPNATFRGLLINNSNNVVLNTGNTPFSGTVTFEVGAAGPSRLIMPGTTRLIEIAGAGVAGNSPTNGWVVGRYQKAAGTGGLSHTYPVGDLAFYTPVALNGTVLTAGSVWAGVTVPDHPSVATSTINPLATVNRYYTLDTTGGITFTANTMIPTFNWVAADMDPSITPANFIVGNYKGTTWTYPAPSAPTATSIKTAAMSADFVGQYAIGEPCGTFTIARNPVNDTACIGGTTKFSVGVAPKAGATYQWRKGTTNIPGATDSIYTIATVTAADAGTYSVVVSSGCTSGTSITSTAATLVVNTPASISTQPIATQDICEGRPVTFSVVAAGTSITYQWRKAGIAIPGATASTYSIPLVTTADAGTYTVDIIGKLPCGIITSANSVLTVKPLPLLITPATTTSFCVGGSVVLNAATTPSTLTYQWRNASGNIAGQTTSSYTATVTGSYRAIITNTANGCSDTSNTIAVNASGAPQAIINPAPSASFCQGTSIVLRGNSTAGLTYQWLLNGNPTPVGTDSTLVATAAGSYVLKVFIGAGCSTTSTPTVLTETPLPTITTTPTGAQAICAGDTLSLTAFYTGATAVWKFNGAPVTPAATGTTYRATAAGAYTVTITNTTTGCVNTSAPVNVTINALPTITATSVNAATFCAGGSDTLRATPGTGLNYTWNRNGSPVTPAANAFEYVATQTGTYTVTATNPLTGCAKTSTGILVTANPLPNVLVTPSLPLSICAGQTNNLCIPAVTGTSYQWKDAGVNIPGATTACYAATTAGTYSVTAITTATGCNATSSISTITVNPAPTATITNTGSTVACAGDTICLNANTGAGLSYQWKINGSNIPGATSSTYCATNTGNYTVEVTNGSNCSTNSGILTLTYNPRPTATISYTTPVTFCEGGAVVLTGVSNTGTSYQWQNNGNPVPGATSNNFIASATGSYSLVITSPNGCSTVSPTILVVVNPLPSPVITRTGSILSTGSYAAYQWYFNSAAVPGATNQSFNATQNGGYEVAVTDANGCVNYSGVLLIGNVSVGTLTPASIKVFPNPARNIVTINAPAQVNIVVRDLTGRLVMKEDNAKQINVANLADGSYLLMISDKNGTMIKMEKLLKVSE